MTDVGRFGVFLPSYVWEGDGPERARGIKAFARRVEALGFDSLFITDHLLAAKRFYSVDWLEPLITLAVAAGATERVRLGTSILIMPLRNPVILAKELATLQFLSDNRVILGAGVGWNEVEYEAVGVHKSERGKRTDEMLDIMMPLLEGERVTYHGEFYDVDDVFIEPRTSQRPLLWIGGGSQLADPKSPDVPKFVKSVKTRTVKADGWIPRPTCPPPDIARDWDELQTAMREAGKDPSDCLVAHEICGVVGLKGRYGAVPLDGVVPLAGSLDHGGPIARSVADVVALLAVMSDTAIGVGTAPGAGAPAAAPRIGVCLALLDRAEPSLREHLDDVLGRAREAGATVSEITLPAAFDGLAAAGQVILEADAADHHRATFAIHAADYAPLIRALVEAGLARTARQLADARRTRAEVLAALGPILDDHDAVLLPVAPDVAPPSGEGTGDGRLCAPASTLGIPAISLPSGLDGDRLPYAIQLVAGLDGLQRLLGAAVWMERLLAFEAAPSV